jgi:hypothetical protein
VTAAHALTWAEFIACTLATAALAARSLRDGLPKIREAQARLTEARAHSRAVRAQLRDLRLELESLLNRQAFPERPPASAREHAE